MSCTARTAYSTVIPAAAGLMVVASFPANTNLHPYLIAMGVLGFAYLSLDIMPTSDDRRASRLLLLATVGALALAVGTAIVLVLPWTQGRVEETMMTIYTPSAEGPDGQPRSRLGELQQLKLSRRIVMRVWSERPQRLRSRVLVRFDGTSWHRDTTALTAVTPHGDVDSAVSVPGRDFVLLPDALDRERRIETRVVRTDGGGLATPGGTYLIRAPIDVVHTDAAAVVFPPRQERVRAYEVLHDLNHQRAQERSALVKESLQLPDALDPRIRELSARLVEGAPNRERAVERIVTHLRENYEYSLDVGAIDRQDPIADFLFRRKEGWCEYFAGSAALMLRTQGIPARYVRGFNVIGSQKKGDHYVVREWDRHAWIEAYIDGKGWLEYDPTPPAEYESLHASLGTGFLSDVVEWVRSWTARGYVALLDVSWTRTLPVLGLVLLGYGVFRVWKWRPTRRKTSRTTPTELEALLRELDAVLEKLGQARPEHTAPLEHWLSLSRDEIPPSLQEVGSNVIDLYYRTVFGGSEVDHQEVFALQSLVAVTYRQVTSG